jgi:hypothetical protein
LTDAERELGEVRSRMPNSEWHRGFLKGLEGLLLASKSNNDRYLYLAKTRSDAKTIRRLKKEFQANASNQLQGSYDKGYFTALLEYAKAMEVAHTNQGLNQSDPKPITGHVRSSIGEKRVKQDERE